MSFRVHREGWPFIGLFAALTIAVFFLAVPLGWLGVILTGWCVWFFRDPERATPPGADLVIAPADGRVLPIVAAPPPPELGMGETPRTRISIFMNVFNVHVNRIPCAGRVVALAYRPGKFINASFDKASEHNERMGVRIRPEGDPENTADDETRDLAVVQIAGLVARRIKCYLSQDEAVRTGERYGIIRFGSRLDVYLPPGAQARVAEGQKTVAGETVLADLGARAIAPEE